MSYINQFNNSIGQPFINSFSEDLSCNIVGGTSGNLVFSLITNNGIVTPSSSGAINFNLSGIYTIYMSLYQISGGKYDGQPINTYISCQLPYSQLPSTSLQLLNANVSGWNQNGTSGLGYSISDSALITVNFPGKVNDEFEAYNNGYCFTLTVYAEANQTLTFTYSNTETDSGVTFPSNLTFNVYMYVILNKTNTN
jgi:hypothetical protein